MNKIQFKAARITLKLLLKKKFRQRKPMKLLLSRAQHQQSQILLFDSHNPMRKFPIIHCSSVVSKMFFSSKPIAA
jgi:hypothetical protein